MELKRARPSATPGRTSCLNRTFYGIETYMLPLMAHQQPVLIVRLRLSDTDCTVESVTVSIP